jgi:hypothetical protein
VVSDFTPEQLAEFRRMAENEAQRHASRRYPPGDERAEAYVMEYAHMEFLRLTGATHDA